VYEKKEYRHNKLALLFFFFTLAFGFAASAHGGVCLRFGSRMSVGQGTVALLYPLCVQTINVNNALILRALLDKRLQNIYNK
jgi:hypothetical protein